MTSLCLFLAAVLPNDGDGLLERVAAAHGKLAERFGHCRLTYQVLGFRADLEHGGRRQVPLNDVLQEIAEPVATQTTLHYPPGIVGHAAALAADDNHNRLYLTPRGKTLLKLKSLEAERFPPDGPLNPLGLESYTQKLFLKPGWRDDADPPRLVVLGDDDGKVTVLPETELWLPDALDAEGWTCVDVPVGLRRQAPVDWNWDADALTLWRRTPSEAITDEIAVIDDGSMIGVVYRKLAVRGLDPLRLWYTQWRSEGADGSGSPFPHRCEWRLGDKHVVENLLQVEFLDADTELDMTLPAGTAVVDVTTGRRIILPDGQQLLYTFADRCVAVAPGATATSGGFPWTSLVLLLAGVIVGRAASVAVATRSR